MVFLLLNKNSRSPWDWMIKAGRAAVETLTALCTALGSPSGKKAPAVRQQISSKRIFYNGVLKINCHILEKSCILFQ